MPSFASPGALTRKLGPAGNKDLRLSWVRVEGHQVLRMIKEGRKQTHVPNVFVVSLNS